jgi:hypothetical protein
MTPAEKQALEDEYGTGYWEALRRIEVFLWDKPESFLITFKPISREAHSHFA